MNEFRKFDFAEVANVTLIDGFWKKKTENYMVIIESMLEALLCPTNSARLLNFGIAAKQIKGEFYGAHWSDGDCYKFIEGCCYIYQNTRDEAVKNIIDQYIPWIVDSQEEDGYIGTQILLTKNERWQDIEHHELYNHGHFITMAVAHYKATKERTLLDCAIKLFEYLYEFFSEYPKEYAHFGMNPSQIMGLYDLYAVTNNPKCYQLAEVFVNMRGSQSGGGEQTQDFIPLREETIATGHAVMSTYLWSGATDVYAQTGEEALIEALKRIWKDLIEKKIYITGGVCPIFMGYSDRGHPVQEAHGTYYDLPNKIAYNETCANIGAAMWAMRMLTVLGEVEYGDWAEQIMYNAGISGASIDMTRYFYSNPLAYRKEVPIVPTFSQYQNKATQRFHTSWCWCCPPQLLRTMSGIGRWVYGKAHNLLYVNLFADSRYADEDIVVEMKTEYPWSETVRIQVIEANNQVLRIRIPKWCKNPTVNNVPVQNGVYFEITVNTGDKLEIVLPMPVRLMQANPNIEQDRGMLCVQRGPVIYCVEGCDIVGELDNIYLDVNAQYLTKYEEDMLGGVVTISTKAKCKKEKNELYYDYLEDDATLDVKFIPYYSWANREEMDMSVWFPKY